jgi:serine/threonine protein kinase
MIESMAQTMDVSEPRVASLLAGRYRLGRVIARGGSGVVYDARDERVGSEVAIKVLRRSLTTDATAVARMVREVELVGRLKHPNVVRVLDVGAEAEEPFLVMELLEGKTLAERVETEGPLSLESVRTIASQLLDALGAVHRAGVLHRDLKPANVFLVSLRGAELVKLLDFGHGALHDGSSPKLTQSGFFAGTPGYIAPERLLGGAHDARSDVYGVAVCLYEALAGRAAFHAASPLALHAAIVQGSAPSLAELRTDVPAELSAVIARAMQVDPALRFGSAAELAAAIEGAITPPRASADPYAKTLAVARHEPSRAPASASEVAPTAGAAAAISRPPARRGPLPVVVMALAVFVLCTLGAVVLRGGDAAAHDEDLEPSTPSTSVQPSLLPAGPSLSPAEPSVRAAEPSSLPAEPSLPRAEPSARPAEPSSLPAEPSGLAAPDAAAERVPSEGPPPRGERASERSGRRVGAPARPRESAAPPATQEVTRDEREASGQGAAEVPGSSRTSHPDEIFVPSWAE